MSEVSVQPYNFPEQFRELKARFTRKPKDDGVSEPVPVEPAKPNAS